MRISKYFIPIVIVFSIACNPFQGKKKTFGKSYAEEQLRLTLSDTLSNNLINNDSLIIKDRKTAIRVSEPILIDIYGSKNIVKQRPYEVYLIGNYWVLSGTLLEDHDGGTFLMIIDARNSKIIKISHGK